MSDSDDRIVSRFRTAGIIWTAIGAIGLGSGLNQLIWIIRMRGHYPVAGDEFGFYSFFDNLSFTWDTSCGIAFLLLGIRVLTGRSRSTHVKVAWSYVAAGLWLFPLLFMPFRMFSYRFQDLPMHAISGIGLMVAGSLATTAVRSNDE